MIGTRIAVELRELGDVLALVAVLGRLLAAPRRLDGRCETLHLRAGVVVVVLALDLVPGEREHASDGVAVRPVPRRRDGDRPGRVRGDHLDLDALRLCRRARPEGAVRAATISATPAASHASGSQRLTNPGPAASARSASPLSTTRCAISSAISRGGRFCSPASFSATFVA